MLKENEDNLAEFEEKLKLRFNRSLDVTEELDYWKKDVSLILRLYMGNRKQIKPAFQLLNSENEKHLGFTGQDFKEKLVNVMDYTEKCMDQYMANYRIEQTFPTAVKAFTIYNPRLDLESLLFNVEIAPIEPVKKTPNKPKTKADLAAELHMGYNNSMQSNPLSQDSMTKNDMTPNRREDNLLTEISIADLPDLEGSKPPRELPPPKVLQFNPNSTGQNFLLKDRSLTKNDDASVTSYLVSQKNLTSFKRNFSPNSNKETMNSPKEKKRASITNMGDVSLANRSLSKKNLLLPEYRTVNPKGKSDRSFTNITDNTSINKKMRESSRGSTLRKLLSGRHGEILADLKKNALSSLDLSFAG